MRTSSALRVLVIDDDPDVVKSTGRMISQLGHQTHVETDAENGLAAALAEEYDLLVCDIVMPGLDGTELIAALQAAGKRTPVILMTGDRDATTIIAGFRAGARDIVLKPFGREDLKASFRRVLGAAGEAPVPISPVLGPAAAVSSAPAAVAAPHAEPHADKSGATGPLADGPSGTRQMALRMVHKLSSSDLPPLPVPPKLVARMSELSEDPAAPDADIEALIQSNVTIAAAVIRAANTATFTRAQEPVTTLREAMIRLGTARALHNALMAAQRANYDAPEPRLSQLLNRMWIGHYLAATIGGHLAQGTRVLEGTRAQSMLLFAEIGEMLVVRGMVQAGMDIFDGNDLNATAMSVLAEAHATAGERALTQWRMPTLYAAMAATHAEADGLAARFPTLARLPSIARRARQLANSHFPHERISVVHPLLPGDRERMPEFDEATLQRVVQASVAQLNRVIGREGQ